MTELLINEMKNNIDIVLCGYRKLHKNDKGKLIIKNSNTYKKINISKDEFMNMFGKLLRIIILTTFGINCILQI